MERQNNYIISAIKNVETNSKLSKRYVGIIFWKKFWIQILRIGDFEFEFFKISKIVHMSVTAPKFISVGCAYVDILSQKRD